MINKQYENTNGLVKIPINKNDLKSKKIIKELPINFFEKVIDLELKIKKDFSMEMLEELTYLYSVKSLLNKLAIEYYESIENPRFRDYQNKLNLLLTQPDIIKKMGNPIYRNKNSPLRTQDYERRKKIDQAKNELKMKINYKSRLKNISNNETEINNLLKNYNKHNKIPHDKVQNDLKQQEINFRERLNLKKKLKNQFSPRVNTQNDFFNLNDEGFTIDTGYNTARNAEKELLLDEKEEGNKSEDISFEKDSVLNKEGEDKSNELENILQNTDLIQFLTQKQKSHFNEIKNSIQIFMKDYSYFYHQNIFDKFKEQSKKLMDEKFKKYSEVAETYYSQIKEVEFILEAEDDVERQTPLKIIIESLKEEQQHQLDLIEDHYEKLFEQCYTSFKTQARTSSGIQLIEEKLRLEIYNQINNLINPKNKF